MSRPYWCTAASPGFSRQAAERRTQPRSDQTPGRQMLSKHREEKAPVTVSSRFRSSPSLFLESAGCR
ncbi:hypothetical protein PBY51_018126 [Eleginops maclovinus]|uniref:Uncharacterized protein n=1 Tax=Eleginops maclovinus TaxID=56733 RepID=A0AAN7XKP8_ELEMC|nr:hypothetical protein PBY51_018126 [Eleginops maclovinus]